MSAQGPLVLGLGLRGLGLRVWGQGLTIISSRITFTVEDVEDTASVGILLSLETECSIAASVGDKYAERGQRLRGQGL